MSSVRITELSANMMEIEIGSEWMSLGKSMAQRYAENLAEAYSLGGNHWRAQQVNPKRDYPDTLVVKLVKTL